MNDLISIIITVYNHESYIRTCIESVLGQTYDNLQIILVDDDSTDSSGEICRNYARKDSRILYTCHPINRGVSSARNTGLSLALGEYIAFVDGDDYVRKDYIHTLYTHLKETGSDIAVCSLLELSENEVPEPEPSEAPAVTVYSNPLELLVDVRWMIAVVVWNKLYHKDVFRTLRFRPHRIHQDEAIIHHILAESKKLVYVNSRQYLYTKHKEGAMNNQTGSTLYDGWLAFYDRVKLFEQKQMLPERDIWIKRTALNLAKCFKMSQPHADGKLWRAAFRQRLMMLLRMYPELKNQLTQKENEYVSKALIGPL